MNNKTIYLDKDTVKCLMEAQESAVSPSKAKVECGLNSHPTVNRAKNIMSNRNKGANR
jgi:hypothetical protein